MSGNNPRKSSGPKKRHVKRNPDQNSGGNYSDRPSRGDRPDERKSSGRPPARRPRPTDQQGSDRPRRDARPDDRFESDGPSRGTRPFDQQGGGRPPARRPRPTDQQGSDRPSRPSRPYDQQRTDRPSRGPRPFDQQGGDRPRRDMRPDDRFQNDRPSRDDRSDNRYESDQSGRDRRPIDQQRDDRPRRDSRPDDRFQNDRPRRDAGPDDRFQSDRPRRDTGSDDRFQSDSPRRDSRPDDRYQNERPVRSTRPPEDRNTERVAAGVVAGEQIRGERPVRGPRTAGGPRQGATPRSFRFKPAPFTIRGDLLFGRNAVLESLRAGNRTPTRLWVAEGLREDERIDEIVRLARANEVLVDTIPRTMLDDQEPEVNHQGVLLETSEYEFADLSDVIEGEGNVLVLDHLQDPQNVGTLLRAADAAGVAGVIIPTDRAATITPAVVNSSAGAVEHLSIASVPNLGNALAKLEASGRWIIGLDSGPDSSDLFTTEIPTPAVLVVGSEGPGLTPNIRRRCQLVVSLPMLGKVESLNASTAGSIALFDLLRRG